MMLKICLICFMWISCIGKSSSDVELVTNFVNVLQNTEHLDSKIYKKYFGEDTLSEKYQYNIKILNGLMEYITPSTTFKVYSYQDAFENKLPNLKETNDKEGVYVIQMKKDDKVDLIYWKIYKRRIKSISPLLQGSQHIIGWL